MIVIYQHRIYRQDIKANPSVLYIFGDNLERKGFGGQAKEMRGEPNSFGIATKRRMSHGSYEDYFHDEEEDSAKTLAQEFFKLWKAAPFYKAVVIPSDGIGTGLAKLSEYAPNLLEYINKQLRQIGTYRP